MPTVEPLAVEPNDYEKERGKPVPSYNHSFVQWRLMMALSTSSEFAILPELALELPNGHRLTPDLAVYPMATPDWRHDVIRMKSMPKLAVEIPSPSQGYQEISDKLDLYFASGVESVWVVRPEMQTIAIYLPDTPRPQVFTTGEARDPATGVTARLEDIFA